MASTDPDPETSREHLRALLRDGMNSSPESEMDPAYFDRWRMWIRADGN